MYCVVCNQDTLIETVTYTNMNVFSIPLEIPTTRQICENCGFTHTFSVSVEDVFKEQTGKSLAEERKRFKTESVEMKKQQKLEEVLMVLGAGESRLTQGEIFSMIKKITGR